MASSAGPAQTCGRLRPEVPKPRLNSGTVGGERRSARRRPPSQASATGSGHWRPPWRCGRLCAAVWRVCGRGGGIARRGPAVGVAVPGFLASASARAWFSVSRRVSTSRRAALLAREAAAARSSSKVMTRDPRAGTARRRGQPRSGRRYDRFVRVAPTVTSSSPDLAPWGAALVGAAHAAPVSLIGSFLERRQRIYEVPPEASRLITPVDVPAAWSR